MHKFSGLPTYGEALTVIVKVKYAAQEEVYAYFGTRKGKHKLVIHEINDLVVRFTTQLLAYKLIQKCQKDEFSLGVVIIVKWCVVRV
jgi:hypothetical protein